MLFNATAELSRDTELSIISTDAEVNFVDASKTAQKFKEISNFKLRVLFRQRKYFFHSPMNQLRLPRRDATTKTDHALCDVCCRKNFMVK